MYGFSSAEAPSFAKLYNGEMRRKPGQGHLKEARPDLGRRSAPGVSVAASPA
jgi:hypothetical protein